jgi:hypothetical protein
MKKITLVLISLFLISPLFCYYGGYGPDPLSLTGNGTISGSYTVGGNIIGSSNIFVSQRAKIGLDGASGNSYIMSDTGDITKFYINGVKNFEIGTSSITCNQTVNMASTKNILLTGDSYIGLLGANPITSPKLVFADGNTDLRGGGWGTTSSFNMWVNGTEVLEVATSSVTCKQPFVLPLVSTATAPATLFSVGRAQNKAGRWSVYMATATVDGKSWMLMGTQTDY